MIFKDRLIFIDLFINFVFLDQLFEEMEMYPPISLNNRYSIYNSLSNK